MQGENEGPQDPTSKARAHRAVPCARSLPPVLSGFGLEQGWWKAGTPPGHGDGDSANLPRHWAIRPAGHIQRCSKPLSYGMAKQSDGSAPKSCWGKEQGVTISQFSSFPNFYLSEDLNLF